MSSEYPEWMEEQPTSSWRRGDVEPPTELLSTCKKRVPLLMKMVNDPNPYIGYCMKFGDELEWFTNGSNTNMYRLLEKWAYFNDL